MPTTFHVDRNELRNTRWVESEREPLVTAPCGFMSPRSH